MGLDFRGSRAHWSYSGFHRFRERIADQLGFDLNSMEGFGGGKKWSSIKDPIVPLLSHSDCDGEMTPQECKAVYPRLREIISEWPADDYDRIHAELLADGMENCAIEETPLIFT